MSSGKYVPQLRSIPSPERSTSLKARESWHILGIISEFVEATERLAEIRPAVSIFGSARIQPGHRWYESTVDIARRLSAQRPADRPPLQVLIEVNVSGESSKGGLAPEEVAGFAAALRDLPGLVLRGLMCLPAPEDDFARQRVAFARLRDLLVGLGDPALDTLSMGTSSDLEAAIAEGATLVRVGTAIFGARA